MWLTLIFMMKNLLDDTLDRNEAQWCTETDASF